MTTSCHTRGGIIAATLPLRVQKRTFSETHMAQGNKTVLKKARVTKSVSRSIRTLSTPVFAGPTFSFSTHYYLLNWGVYETAPMDGVEAVDAFTFGSHYSSPSGAADEAVPMDGVEYTSKRQPEKAKACKNGAAFKMAAPKPRRHGVVRGTSDQVQASTSSNAAGKQPAVQKVAIRRPQIRLTIDGKSVLL